MSAKYDNQHKMWVINFAEAPMNGAEARGMADEVAKGIAKIGEAIMQAPTISADCTAEVDRVIATATNIKDLQSRVSRRSPSSVMVGDQVAELMVALDCAANNLPDVGDQRLANSLLGYFATEFEVEVAQFATEGVNIKLPVAA